MAIPQTKVFIAFDLSFSGNGLFILNDTTQGLLDSAFVLGGDILQDVTQYVASVSINRGKSRELERYSAGQASVTLHNESRIFDPFNSVGIYFGQILPRKQLVIQTNGELTFSGYVDDWDFTYDIGGKSFASVSAIDGFSLLSGAELSSFTTTSQLSSDRVTAILNRSEVAWPIANRNIETGLSTFQADTVAINTNALSYLQLVETTENGRLFMSRDNKLTFDSRANRPPTSPVIFADDGTALSIPYQNISVMYGSENLFNRVTITRNGGTAQVANSTTSQTTFGISALSIDSLLFNDDTDTLRFAEYLVGAYDEPELRIDTITVNLASLDSLQVQNLTTLDMGDVIQVKFTPNQTGSQIVQNSMVQGISHSIGIDTHEITISMASIEYFPFILDDAVYGLLDSGILTY